MQIKQRQKLTKSLQDYRKRYLVKKYETLDESATRLMINQFLNEILGFAQIDEIKTEYSIKGTYADYVIQLARKKWFIVEVKSIQIDLQEQHLRQAINYAANEGIDWVLLTNGKVFELYKVLFSKPINHKKVFSFNLADKSQLRESIDYFEYLTKSSLAKGDLNRFWARFQALEPANLARELYDPVIVRFLKRKLKAKSGINFSDEDLEESIYQIILQKIDVPKPRTRVKKVLSKMVKREEVNVAVVKEVLSGADIS